MNVYIKPKRKTNLCNKTEIKISDVAEVIAPKDELKKINKMKLQSIKNNGEKKTNYVVSVTDIITLINNVYPNATINNVGETDTWVQHITKKSHDNKVLKWLKVLFVSIVLMIGSSTAIMSFHTDGQLSKVFEKYYQIFYGEEKTNPLIINIPYSIGLAVGIIVFYNHFMGKKITDDPTPVEVEMELYDRDVTDTVIDILSQKQEGDNNS